MNPAVTRTSEKVAAAVRARRTARLVAIDGAGGSGKSTLAAAVAGLLGGCPVVAGDDFYRPMTAERRAALDPRQGYDGYFDWARLREQVLGPVRAGRAARYQRYDWERGELGGWREIGPGPVVIVEGVYVTRPELDRCHDFTVFVDTAREVCLRRLRARGENPEEWIMKWRAAEDYYLTATRPQDRADLVVTC